LSWTYASTLAPDEYFDVRVWQDGQPAYGIANVRETTYAIGDGFPNGLYNWTIAVINRVNGIPVTLAQATTIGKFTWAQPGSAGGTTAATATPTTSPLPTPLPSSTPQPSPTPLPSPTPPPTPTLCPVYPNC
jgi:hypothetical protein